MRPSCFLSDFDGYTVPKVSLLLYYMCAKRIKFLMTRLSVCGLGVSCNEMNDTPMLLVVGMNYIYNQNFIYKDGLVGQSRIFATTSIFE